VARGIHLTGDVWIDSEAIVTIEPGTIDAGGCGIVDEMTVDDPSTLET